MSNFYDFLIVRTSRKKKYELQMKFFFSLKKNNNNNKTNNNFYTNYLKARKWCTDFE